MENFEGRNNPEIKDIKKMSFGKRLSFAAAILFGSALGPNSQDTTTPKIPDEIRSDDPPKPKLPQSEPKNI